MPEKKRFFKQNKGDTIWWVDNEEMGTWEFSFDKKTTFYMFQDYPWKLTAEQTAIFDRENP